MAFKSFPHRWVMPAVVAGFCAVSLFAAGQGSPFAQSLVTRTHASHPEVSELGIAARTAHGCINIASTDRSDVGEKCEQEDMTPMRTGRAVVGKEGSAIDISLPLHDASGHLVGSAGIEIKPKPGESRAAVVAKAKTIAHEMEKQIPSKARLLGQ